MLWDNGVAKHIPGNGRVTHRSTISAWESAFISWNFYRKENYKIFNKMKHKMSNALLIHQIVIENRCKLWKKSGVNKIETRISALVRQF